MGELYSTINIELLRDYLIFLASIFILLLFFIAYLLIKNYISTKHVEMQIKHFNLERLEKNNLTSKLYSIENKLFKYGLLDPGLKPLERILDAYAVTVMNMDGVITYANDSFCEINGYSREELTGRTHAEIHAEEMPPPYWKKMQSNLKKGLVWHSEIAGKRKDGSLFWTDTTIIPLSLLTEKDIGYISLSTDISHLREDNQKLAKSVMEKERKLHTVEGILVQSEKMASMGMLAAGVAHEINNPIAYISSNTAKMREYIDGMSSVIHEALAIAEDSSTPDLIKTRLCEAIRGKDDIHYLLQDSQSMLSETIDGIERVRKIVSDLKSFSHNGNGKKTNTDINKCIESALTLANNEIKYKATVVRDFDPIPAVYCNESQINQVILNLLVNAAHAIDKSGTISVKTRAIDNKHISISISDTGSGISEETLGRIFEPFFTTKPVGKGTGIGLSISNDIIHKHNGKIAVSSTTGKGTTFTIILPVEEALEEKLAS